MLKDVTLVPKDKCPLDVLAEMGEQTANAWIFLHKNAVEKLRSTADIVTVTDSFLKMHWKETEKYPSTTILVKHPTKEYIWQRIYHIMAIDIAFDYEPSDPEHLFFLQMEE